MRKFIFVFLIVFIASKTLRLLTEEKKDLKTGLTAKKEEKQQVAKLTIAQKIKNITGDLCDTYDRLTQSFKVTKSETVKKFITREGFSQLKLTSRLFYNKNLMDEKYMEYMNKRAKGLGIKNDDLEDYLTTVEFMPFEEGTGMFDAKLFYKDGRGDNSYSSFNVIATMGSMNGRYDILIHHFRIFDFQLADDILWTEKSSNYCNIFQQTKQEFKKIPKSLSEAQVQSLIDFYKILSLKFVGDTFGINLNLPNLK